MRDIVDLSISSRACPVCDLRLLRIEYEWDDAIPGGDLFHCDDCEITFLGANIRRAMPLKPPVQLTV